MGRLAQTEGLTEFEQDILATVRDFTAREILPVVTGLEHRTSTPHRRRARRPAPEHDDVAGATASAPSTPGPAPSTYPRTAATASSASRPPDTRSVASASSSAPSSLGPAPSRKNPCPRPPQSNSDRPAEAGPGPPHPARRPARPGHLRGSRRPTCGLAAGLPAKPVLDHCVSLSWAKSSVSA